MRALRKTAKKHWTGVVRFKAANMNEQVFVLKFGPGWLPAGAPVCDDHPLQPDEREFMRKVWSAQKNK